MGVTRSLAEFALAFELEEAPSEVVDRARMRVLDTLGVALAGSQAESSQIASRTDESVGGAGDNTVIGMKRRTSPLQAAFINGVSSHALEFDDMTSSVVTHTSATVVPSMLSLAESIDAGGAEFLSAYIVGFEISTRIGWGMQHNLLPRGWHPNGVLAGIGSAAGGARLLGCSIEQTLSAIGIAASCSAGLRKNVGTMTKPFHMGHAALNGILAASLAKNGFTADTSIFEKSDHTGSAVPSVADTGHGYYSFPEVFAGAGGFDPSKVLADIGRHYELASDSTITRFHPGSTFPQAAIDETIALAVDNDIDPAAIDVIRVGVTPMCLSIAPYRKPTNGVHARFCAPYSIAVAAIDREVSIRQYDDERVGREDVQSLIDSVQLYIPDDFSNVTHSWPASPPTPVSCRVEIFLKDGQVFRGERHTTRGYPGAPVAWTDVEAKFRDCASIILGPEQIETLVGAIGEIEHLDRIRRLTGRLH